LHRSPTRGKAARAGTSSEVEPQCFVSPAPAVGAEFEQFPVDQDALRAPKVDQVFAPKSSSSSGAPMAVCVKSDPLRYAGNTDDVHGARLGRYYLVFDEEGLKRGIGFHFRRRGDPSPMIPCQTTFRAAFSSQRRAIWRMPGRDVA
jgi:hypothetical protein